MQQDTPQQPAIVEGAASGAGPDASWRWPEARWRQAVNQVRAGARRCDPTCGPVAHKWLWRCHSTSIRRR